MIILFAFRKCGYKYYLPIALTYSYYFSKFVIIIIKLIILSISLVVHNTNNTDCSVIADAIVISLLSHQIKSSSKIRIKDDSIT